MTHGNRHPAHRDLDTAPAPKHPNDLPVLSEDDRHRLLREWADANARGDLDARQRIRAEILGQADTDDGSDSRNP
ncbi:MAG: hypothetical protein AAF637_26300 [Pseudomonadota bacterium]